MRVFSRTLVYYLHFIAYVSFVDILDTVKMRERPLTLDLVSQSAVNRPGVD